MRKCGYPIGWFLFCLALGFLSPSLLSVKADVEFNGPVSLTLAGLWRNNEKVFDIRRFSQTPAEEISEPVIDMSVVEFTPEEEKTEESLPVSIEASKPKVETKRSERPFVAERSKKVEKALTPSFTRSVDPAESISASPFSVPEGEGMMGPSVSTETAQKTSGGSNADKARLIAQLSSEDGSPVNVSAEKKPAYNPLPYSDAIDRIAREHGVSPALAAAVIKVESGFKPNAKSYRGARGLMQLLPATAKKVGVSENINEPEHNIRAGVRYLKEMLDRYNGDERMALAAYNAGPGAVDRYNNVPPYRETKSYVPRVLKYFEEYMKYFKDI